MNRELFVIAHDIRSTYNVGALFRLCDGVAVKKLYLTGYTPYPAKKTDTRLPHIQTKLSKQINKTALGAETSVDWEQKSDPKKVIADLKKQGVAVIGLEQTASSVSISNMHIPVKTCILLGREVEGIEQTLLELCDSIVEIPMLGTKESHNVVQAAAMVLYNCRFVL